MTSGRVADDLSRSPKGARGDAEDAFGERLRSWIVRSGAKFTDVARCLGIRRERLYDVMDGNRPFNGAWFDLLPPAVLRVAIAEMAGERLGEDLTPRAANDEQSDGRLLSDLVRELGEVASCAAESQADGYLGVEDCERELAEIEDAERVLAARKARLREVLAVRGAPVRIAAGAKR